MYYTEKVLDSYAELSARFDLWQRTSVPRLCKLLRLYGPVKGCNRSSGFINILLPLPSLWSQKSYNEVITVWIQKSEVCVCTDISVCIQLLRKKNNLLFCCVLVKKLGFLLFLFYVISGIKFLFSRTVFSNRQYLHSHSCSLTESIKQGCQKWINQIKFKLHL